MPGYNYCKRKLFTTVVLVLSLLFLFVGQPTQSEAAPNATNIDEIVVVGTDGFIYAFDYEGNEVYKSSEGGWTLVTLADLNNDGDQEIVAVGATQLKVYDPQIIGSPMSFSATYNANAGQFVKAKSGNLIRNDAADEIALLFSTPSSNKPGRIIVYDPPNTSPVIDAGFDTNWDDLTIGDFDGDEDDDFALIDWNPDFSSGAKSFFELRYGDNPLSKLDNNADGAGQYSDNRWLDVATGNFVTTNGDKDEWVGSRVDGDRNIIAQRYSNQEIKDIKYRDDAFDFLATADFRDDGVDQIVMLKNTSNTSEVGLRFVVANDSGELLKPWANLTGLGTGWLNLAAGNIDTDERYREAVILRSNLIRVYRLAQSSSVNMDCADEGECLEIGGSFKGPLVVGDLGETIVTTKPFLLTPSIINRSVVVNQNLEPTQLAISGEKAIGVPINWWAIALPRSGSAEFQQALKDNPDLAYTISEAGLSYRQANKNITVPSVPWIKLSVYTGTTPMTLTLTFSNTFPGSLLAEEGTYRAFIQVWQNDTSNTPIGDLVRFSDVTISVGQAIYLPILLK